MAGSKTGMAIGAAVAPIVLAVVVTCAALARTDASASPGIEGPFAGESAAERGVVRSNAIPTCVAGKGVPLDWPLGLEAAVALLIEVVKDCAVVRDKTITVPPPFRY